VTGDGARALDPARTLAWMREHGDVLRELLGEEEPGASEDEAGPAGDAAIRAHLRFVAVALEETAAPPLDEELVGFVHDLPAWFEEGRGLYAQHLATGAGAIALEAHLQFGAAPGTDPSLDAGLRRRVRIGGWIRVFLLGLELRLGPASDGVATQTLLALEARQRELGKLIFSLYHQATAEAVRRAGPDRVDGAVRDEIGQLVVLHVHVRTLIDALAETLPRAS